MTNLLLYQRIAQQLAEDIRRGVYQPGERVPSVRKMSAQLNVSHATVLQAYANLEDQGLIRARPQSGFYVHQTPALTAPTPDIPDGPGEDVDVVNRGDRALPPGVRQARSLPAGPMPDMVVLGIKPQQLAEASAVYAAAVADAPILLSMLAGVDPATLGAAFPGPVPIQTMPNLPVELGRGARRASEDAGDRGT